MDACYDVYEPSALVSWVHKELPFLDIGFNNSRQDAESLVDSLSDGVDNYYDYFVRAVVWGTIVTLAHTPLLVLPCVWYCCTARLCKQSMGEGNGYKLAKAVCGVLLILLILLAISITGVGLWAEEQFNNGFRDNIDTVQSFRANVSINSTGSSGNGTISGRDTLDILEEFEALSHWIFITYFSSLLLPLIGVLLAIIATALCKHPISMIIMLIVLLVTSLLLVFVTGVAVIFLILYSDVCVGLQYKQFHDVTGECLSKLADYSDTLDKFCNDAYLAGVIMLVATSALLIVYTCVQLSGSCFAGLYTGYRGSARIQPLNNEEDEESHELQSCTVPPTPQEELGEADTTALLSSTEEREPQSPMTAEVQQYLSNQPPNPTPSAPPQASATSTPLPPNPSPCSSPSHSTSSTTTLPPVYPPFENSSVIIFGQDTETV